ncbi:hypothetical protein EBT31_21790 [bacterium]|nr:hypothetical protein [bacterium]
MTLVWRPGFQFDADASTYIEAVEAADTQALETGVRYAINNFVIGCKQDGIWPAIKASCILAGARTRTGALVPLVGTAPTSFYFVDANYDRKTGLLGDGTSKYLNSNRNNNTDPQNNKHLSAYISNLSTIQASLYLGCGAGNATGRSSINQLTITSQFAVRNNNGATSSTPSQATGFVGTTRSQSANFQMRVAGNTAVTTATSETPMNENIGVFAQATAANYSNARLAFYSIGESLDLALLDTRVTALITAIGAAIP